MIKKTRININTNSSIYIKTLWSFVFGKTDDYFKTFSKKLKEYLRTDNLLVTAQGRVAGFNIFKVLINPNKNEIIISPYTLTEVINAIIYAGAKPIYVEIDIKTGLPLHSDLDYKINKNTAAVVLTHLYSNKEDILKFKDRYFGKVTIVEDVAINFGAKIEENKYLGTIFDYGFYSFGVMKNLFTFHGGAIYARDKKKLDEIENNIKTNVNYPTLSSIKLVLFCLLIDTAYSKYIYNLFTHHILNLSLHSLDKIMYPGVFPKFLDKMPSHYKYKFRKNFSIAGIENLNGLRSRINNRVENVKLYEKYLNKDLLINSFESYEINSFLEYPILLKNNKSTLVSSILLSNGYDIRHTWYVNSTRFLKLTYDLKSFPNCEILHNQILSLPTHSNIKENDIVKICRLINELEK